MWYATYDAKNNNDRNRQIRIISLWTFVILFFMAISARTNKKAVIPLIIEYNGGKKERLTPSILTPKRITTTIGTKIEIV